MTGTSLHLWALTLAILSCSIALANGQNAVLRNLTTQRTITVLDKREGLNPLGLAAITFNLGKLKAGNFLTTQWNDGNNSPGQGRTILQVTPDGQTSVFARIDASNPVVTLSCGNTGVGLTMALTILRKGFVVVGSTPIPVNSTVAGPGCLIVLDSNGTVVDARAANEKTSSNTMTGGGPWALAVQEFNAGATVYLFVSYVLGANPASTTTLTGAQGGMVVRYDLVVGSSSVSWGAAPDVVASGFPTQPGNIVGGAVGPAGLFISQVNAQSPFSASLGQSRLFISNLLNNSVNVVQMSTFCSTRPSAIPQCQLQAVAWGGLLNQPIGIAQSPFGSIVGANGGTGTLFEIAPTPSVNNQLASRLADNTSSALFNVLFHPGVQNTMFYNNRRQNTYNTLKPPSIFSGAPVPTVVG